jgi:hypothetical protein
LVDSILIKVVIGQAALFPDDEAPDLNAPRLVVLAVGAVVTDEGIGGDQNLPGIRGVGEHLLIAHHAGIENHLTIGIGLSTKGETFVD